MLAKYSVPAPVALALGLVVALIGALVVANGEDRRKSLRVAQPADRAGFLRPVQKDEPAVYVYFLVPSETARAALLSSPDLGYRQPPTMSNVLITGSEAEMLMRTEGTRELAFHGVFLQFIEPFPWARATAGYGALAAPRAMIAGDG